MFISLLDEASFQIPMAFVGILVFIFAFPFSAFIKWDNAVKFELLNFKQGKDSDKLKPLYRFKFLGAVFFRGKKRTQVDNKTGGLSASSSKTDSLLSGCMARAPFFIECAYYFFGILGIVLSVLYEFSGAKAFFIVMVVYMVLYAVGYCVVSFLAISKERTAAEMWLKTHPADKK